MDSLVTLRENQDNLAPRDRDFAASLLTSAASRRGLSPKQAYWVGELAKRATAPRTAPQTVDVGDLDRIWNLIYKARENLSRPAILIMVGGTVVRLSVAGPNSRYAGQIMVSERGDFESRTYFGRIDSDGRFYPSPRAADHPDAVALPDALKAFAADPVLQARGYGKLTGACCFCGRPLSDARSASAGYGPTCAANFGLQWGEVSDILY